MIAPTKEPAGAAPGARPKTSAWRSTVLVIAALGLYFVWTRPVAPPPGWSEDFEAALQEARSTNRPILVEFHYEGCAPCRLMERQVLPDARVQDALRGFVPVRIDGVRRSDLMQRYDVPGTPAFVVADADGRAFKTILGGRTVKDFLEFLHEGAAAIRKGPPLEKDPVEVPQ